jgi:hypothetical protein
MTQSEKPVTSNADHLSGQWHVAPTLGMWERVGDGDC